MNSTPGNKLEQCSTKKPKTKNPLLKKWQLLELTKLLVKLKIETNIIYDNLLPNKTYYWRTKCRNFRGWGEFSEIWNFSTVLVSVETDKLLPAEFLLEQNYPNPFNPNTIISFSIPKRSNVILKVYDILGNELVTLINEETDAGRYNINFNASGLPTGVYFYQLVSSDFVETKKMMLLK